MSYLALQSNLSPQQHNYIHKVHSSAEALLRIINDILDFSKIEAGKLDVEAIAFSLGDVADNVVNILSMPGSGMQQPLRPSTPGPSSVSPSSASPCDVYRGAARESWVLRQGGASSTTSPPFEPKTLVRPDAKNDA